MPKEHDAYIPLAYYWSRRPVDSKFRRPKNMKIFGLEK
jgi:hypothetical protein